MSCSSDPKTKKPQTESEIGNRSTQIVSSDDGFDQNGNPPCFCHDISQMSRVKSVEEGTERHQKFCRYAKLGIEKYNSDHATNYEFVKFVDSLWLLVAGQLFYITLEAKEASDDVPTTFQAMIYKKIPLKPGTERIEVQYVRKKSCATEEVHLNKVLKCDFEPEEGLSDDGGNLEDFYDEDDGFQSIKGKRGKFAAKTRAKNNKPKKPWNNKRQFD